MNKALDRAGMVLGWVFILLTLVVALSPGGIFRVKLDGWALKKRQDKIIKSQWNELASSSTLLGHTMSAGSIVEFIDYRCSFCRALEGPMSAALSLHPDRAIAIRHAPRPGDPESWNAAAAAICAEGQGKFDEMHNYLLTKVSWGDNVRWDSVAIAAGVPDIASYYKCMSSPATAQVIREDSVWVEKLAIRATPVLVSRAGGVHVGMADVTQMSQWLVTDPGAMAQRNRER